MPSAIEENAYPFPPARYSMVMPRFHEAVLGMTVLVPVTRFADRLIQKLAGTNHAWVWSQISGERTMECSSKLMLLLEAGAPCHI